MDKEIHHFDVDEKTMDKVHHFHFRRNSDGKCVMNYQLKRYANAVYPRKYPHLGAIHESPVYGPGKVVSFDCYVYRDSDATKKKFWIYDIVYERKDGNIQEKITLDAKDTFIVMFPNLTSRLPCSFELASFKDGHQDVARDQKVSIRLIF